MDFASGSEGLGWPWKGILTFNPWEEGAYSHANERTHNRRNRKVFVYFPFPVLRIARSFPPTRAPSHGSQIHSNNQAEQQCPRPKTRWSAYAQFSLQTNLSSG